MVSVFPNLGIHIFAIDKDVFLGDATKKRG